MKKTLANLLMASAVLPLVSRSKKQTGSKNSCPFCYLGDNMSFKEMRELAHMCDYHLDDDVLEQVVRQDYSLLNQRFGSANIANKAKGNLQTARSALTKDLYNKFEVMLSTFTDFYPELSNGLYDLYTKLKPYEFRLLANMGFTKSQSKYFFARSMVQMASVIGVRNFINRYLF